MRTNWLSFLDRMATVPGSRIKIIRLCEAAVCVAFSDDADEAIPKVVRAHFNAPSNA